MWGRGGRLGGRIRGSSQGSPRTLKRAVFGLGRGLVLRLLAHQVDVDGLVPVRGCEFRRALAVGHRLHERRVGGIVVFAKFAGVHREPVGPEGDDDGKRRGVGTPDGTPVGTRCRCRGADRGGFLAVPAQGVSGSAERGAARGCSSCSSSRFGWIFEIFRGSVHRARRARAVEDVLHPRGLLLRVLDDAAGLRAAGVVLRRLILVVFVVVVAVHVAEALHVVESRRAAPGGGFARGRRGGRGSRRASSVRRRGRRERAALGPPGLGIS